MIEFRVIEDGRRQSFKIYGHFPLTGQELENAENVKKENTSGGLYNLRGFLYSLIASGCGFLIVNYSPLSDFLKENLFMNFLVFFAVFSCVFFLLGLLPIFKGKSKIADQDKKNKEYLHFKSQDNESLMKDTFFLEAFPDIVSTFKLGKYDQVRLFDKKALEQRMELLFNSKTYGKEFSLLIKEVMINKETMPKRDRKKLEETSGKTVRRLYDLIVSNKMDNLENGSLTNLEAQLLGFEELLEKGMKEM